jgi:hypothetical protein
MLCWKLSRFVGQTSLEYKCSAESRELQHTAFRLQALAISSPLTREDGGDGLLIQRGADVANVDVRAVRLCPATPTK